jgi:hypothetical protein
VYYACVLFLVSFIEKIDEFCQAPTYVVLNRNKNITGITNKTIEYRELALQNDTFIETKSMFTFLFEVETSK